MAVPFPELENDGLDSGQRRSSSDHSFTEESPGIPALPSFPSSAHHDALDSESSGGLFFSPEDAGSHPFPLLPDPEEGFNPSPPELPSTSPVVGIDLGTTFSCVAVWEGGRANVIANNMGNRTTPSWASFQADNVFVGEAARTKASRNPQCTVFDAKRVIGCKMSDPSVQQSLKLWPFKVTEHRGNCAFLIGTQVYMPEEISAYVLVKMKHTAEDYLGTKVEHAVVTVPAYFNDAQRQATIDAASIAGLRVERIINEPTAAALAYGLEKMEKGDSPLTLLVYDLGGGTLDVTILVLDGGVFEVKSTSGDTHLGGQDFDHRLVEHFLPEVQAQCGVDILDNAKALKKLHDACQRLKHDLSHSDAATVEVDALVNGEDFESVLSREKFVEINQPLFDRCLKPVKQALKDARMTENEIDEVVLIGGSTRIVRVQQLLEEVFPRKKLSKKINPDEAVAMGAAIQGANLAHLYEAKDSKLEGITLMDVTPLSLGIELASGKMSTIIKRNTTIPYSHTRVYKNNEDYQTKAVVEVFEGEEKYTKNNRLLGRFTLPGLPPKRRGLVQIPITFTVDTNGVLEVVACVSGEEGTAKRLIIQKDKGLLTEDEIGKKAKLLAKWEKKCRIEKLN